MLNAKAATGIDFWVGNTSVNWGDANWSGANNPPIAGDSLSFGPAGSAGTALNNNSAATSFAGLTFNNTAAGYTIAGNSITLSGGVVDNSVNPETLNLPLALSATANVGVGAGGVLTLGGVISGTAFGLTATGLGTVGLNGSVANTYGGATTVNAGTLLLDFANFGATANLISAASSLALGGGTFQVNGNAANAISQTVNATTVNPGADVISVGPNGGNPANPLPTPRPISSRMMSERWVALLRMFAVSFISTMKVLCPRERSSLAPMRVKMRSRMGMDAFCAGM